MRKLIATVALFITGTILTSYLYSSSKDGDLTMSAPLYTLQFNTTSTYCKVLINGVPIINNFPFDTGTISTGLTVNAFLANGTNTLTLRSASLNGRDGIEEYLPNARCETVLSHKVEQEILAITGITITPDSNFLPTSITSPSFNEVTTGPIINKGYVSEDSVLWDHSRTFTLSGLPEWRWTTAPKLSNTPDMNRQLREAYRELWEAMHRKDYNRFKQLNRLAMEEHDIAEGFKPGYMLSTLPYEERFKSPDFKMLPLDFERDNYRFTTYAEGRLVRFDEGNGLSPLRQDVAGTIYTYNPYFSMIDGKLQVSR